MHGCANKILTNTESFSANVFVQSVLQSRDACEHDKTLGCTLLLFVTEVYFGENRNYNPQFHFVHDEFPPHILCHCIKDAFACTESTPVRPVHSIMRV